MSVIEQSYFNTIMEKGEGYLRIKFINKVVKRNILLKIISLTTLDTFIYKYFTG